MNKGETTTDSIIELTSQRSIAKSENIWKNSPFGFLVPLTSDERGHWGEDYFQELLKKHTKFVVEWNGDKNIKEDSQGRDFLTFECPACKTTQKSHRVG